MRHISFDESTILTEYAKIAQEKGLIKTAQEPREMPAAPVAKPLPAPEQPRLTTEQVQNMVGWYQEDIQAYPVLYRLYKGQLTPKEGKALLNEIQSGAMRTLSEKMIPKLYNDLRSKMFVFVRPMLRQSDLARLNELAPTSQHRSVRKGEDNSNTNVKTADDRVYDVTGETGEQLIDSAHPGGGTRTELTHSKTKENLIETIVEQQKRDIEVARSVPKGTYAALIGLYDVLNKMGHKDHLGGLVKIIKRIATYEDIMVNTLLTLADVLDSRGLKNATEHVDKMLEKMAIIEGLGPAYVGQPAPAAVTDADQKIAQLTGNLENSLNSLPAGAETAAGEIRHIVQYLQGLKGKGLTTDKLQNQVIPSIQQYMSNFSPAAINVMSPLFEGGVSAPVAPAPTGAAGVEKKQSQGEIVGQFQMAYNIVTKGVKTPLVVDKKRGPKTRAAIQEMRVAGGWKGFKAKMDEARAEGVAGTEEKPGGFLMAEDEIQEYIFDRVKNIFGEEFDPNDTNRLNEMARATAIKHREKKNITTDEAGRSRLDDFVNKMTSAPGFKDRVLKALKWKKEQ